MQCLAVNILVAFNHNGDYSSDAFEFWRLLPSFDPTVSI